MYYNYKKCPNLVNEFLCFQAFELIILLICLFFKQIHVPVKSLGLNFLEYELSGDIPTKIIFLDFSGSSNGWMIFLSKKFNVNKLNKLYILHFFLNCIIFFKIKNKKLKKYLRKMYVTITYIVAEIRVYL